MGWFQVAVPRRVPGLQLRQGLVALWVGMGSVVKLHLAGFGWLEALAAVYRKRF
ncbi:hypothetical protein [uncultured Ruegeria sp.]|uniref:hypothetical protein n=1 Tax=uncultured Ruegeria sp. TaxID=259304 RepID=UPI00261F1621|nr:hypothetical protein [uncultured Ruegeria sp.]